MVISAGAKRFVLLLNVHTGSGDHLAFHSIGPEFLSRGVKRPGQEVDN